MIFRIIFLFALAISGLSSTGIFAQNSQEYTDYKPEYTKWQEGYILDKIDYTSSSTILYFRFVFRSGMGVSAIFYPPGGESPWYLKGKSGKNYYLKTIKNIRRNSELLVSNLIKTLEFPSLNGFGYTVFSCEVHFDRLPNTEKAVDLIEGVGFERDPNHFNCFNIKLKTSEDKDLGEIKDSENNVQKFENKFGIVNQNPKPTPKVEPRTDNPKDIVSNTPPKKEEIKPEVKKTSPKPDPNNPYPSPRLRSASDIECGKKLVVDAIQFQDNTTDLVGMVECQTMIQVILKYMTDNPKSTAIIIGHTDVFGPFERNMELSKQRAVKIQRWLSSLGIDPKRITVEYHGPKKPIKKEGSPLNRRVEIVINC
jgi:outer membrane protein OmpA-like peptidoglycan-associated protein